MISKHEELVQLFRSAGQAHHRAFAAVNGDDPEWPQWYAEYLRGPLSQLLDQPFEIGRLAADLRELDEEMRRLAPSADWLAYYADWFLAQHAAQ